MYGPLDPAMPCTPVIVTDIGMAAATILANPGRHGGKVYNLVSDRYTHNQLASYFTDTLGKEVKFVRIPYDAAKKIFMETGFPEWQADAVLELFKLFDVGSPVTNQADLGDYERITGGKPTAALKWVKEHADAFK
eukprot:m.234012 g.234012  ORF g.234012 m.234012 type:complete len:135 (+) comp40102_c3_seq5:1466-1870(+)